MKHRTIKLAAMTAAVAAAVLHMGVAAAQEAAPAATAAASAAAPADGLNMERVVVTGTTTGSSKMKTSVSISTIEGDVIKNSAALSAAEVLRAVPGVRAESSGGDGGRHGGQFDGAVFHGGLQILSFCSAVLLSRYAIIP